MANKKKIENTDNFLQPEFTDFLLEAWNHVESNAWAWNKLRHSGAGRAKVHLSGGEEFGGRELGCYCYKIIV